MPRTDSFRTLKRDWGAAGEGLVWHHIVEQSKVDEFGARTINSAGNVMAITREVNQKLNAHYSSKFFWTNGKTVREWLKGRSWEEQFRYGVEALENALKDQQ